MISIFNSAQKEKAEFILNHPFARLSNLRLHEIQDIAVVMSYYSCKITGNAYTFVEVESLLKDGITSKRRYEDANILICIYEVLISNMEFIHKEKKQVIIDGCTLLGMCHAVHEREVFNVNILRELLQKQQLYIDPLERAVFLHCNIAQLQPFINVGSHLARMVENLVLMNADIIPVYSSKDADILNYRKGLIDFYKTGDYSLYADYFLNKQIERIKEIE